MEPSTQTAMKHREGPPTRRTGIKTGGTDGRYWVCWSRRRFFLEQNDNCNISIGRHRDCGWYGFVKHD